MLDFVKPHNNEQDFSELAEILGLKLCFVYDKLTKNTTKFPTALIVNRIPDKKDIKDFDFLIFDSSKQPRSFASVKQPAIMINCELDSSKDNLIRINSGITDVIAAIMSKNNKIYGINLSNFFYNSLPKDILLRRIAQNIKLCRKYNVPFIPLTLAEEPLDLRNPSDIKSFLSLFQVSPDEVKRALSFFDDII